MYLNRVILQRSYKTSFSLLQVSLPSWTFNTVYFTALCVGSPTQPQPAISYDEHQMSLIVSWNEPFTHTGFPVTYYKLQITNVSDFSGHNTHQDIVNISNRLYYVNSVDSLPTTCYELEYNVTAFNEIGSSAVGSVIGRFPICKWVILSTLLLHYCILIILKCRSFACYYSMESSLPNRWDSTLGDRV